MSASSGVLLITGGEAVMRQTFNEHGRAYWSAEFALILEKHGWLDFQVAGPETLEDLRHLRDYAAVIVAWLPEDQWRPSFAETLRAYEGVLLLEGPFPPLIEDLLGIERAGEPISAARGPMTLSPSAQNYVNHRFGEQFPIGHRSAPEPSFRLSAHGEPNPLELVPRQSATRPPGLARDAYSEIGFDPLERNAGRAAVSLSLAYRARFARNRRFFDDSAEDALALLVCVRCLAALSADGPLKAAFRDLILEAAASGRHPVDIEDERSALARTIAAAALVEASRDLDLPEFAERAKQTLDDIRIEWRRRRPADPEVARWRVLLAILMTEPARMTLDDPDPALLDVFLPAVTRPWTPVMRWLDVSLAARLKRRPPSLEASAEWLEDVALKVTASSGGLPKVLTGMTLPDVALVMGMLRKTGHVAAARRIWRVLVEDAYDTKQGLFMGATVVDGGLVPAMGFATSPKLALGLLEVAGSIDIVDPPMKALRSYSKQQLDAWSGAPYVLQPYQGVDDDTIVSVNVEGTEMPLLWQRGKVIATGCELLAHLVHMHTVEPVSEPFTAFRSTDALVLEYLLIHVLGTAMAQGAPSTVHVGPWPWGAKYVLTIRHDVDRVLTTNQFARLFEFERKQGLAVSWFWLPDRLEAEQLAALDRDSGHEIALHAIRFDNKARELAVLKAAVSRPILGEAIHGAGDGWLGHLGVRAAIRAGLLYTELAPSIADCPYARYPWVDAEGRVGSDRIIGVTYNISIDGRLGTQPGSEGGPGLYRQLLNHPDLNFDRLENWVEALPVDGRINWTCEQVARWWRATHSGRLTVRHEPTSTTGQFSFNVSAAEGVADAELRVPCPPSSVSSVTVDADEAEWDQLTDPEYPGIAIRVSLEPGIARSVTVRYSYVDANQEASDTSTESNLDPAEPTSSIGSPSQVKPAGEA